MPPLDPTFDTALVPSAAASACEPGCRLLLYSHDSYGLGHLQRSLTLARALVAHLPEASALVVTGSPCATQFALPPRVDVVKLPAVTKDERGDYRPRALPQSLRFVSRLRRALLLESFRAFEPQLVLVDHQVLGLGGEVAELLVEARRTGVPALFGMRDVLDAPEAVAREWSGEAVRWALSEGYAHLLVYGAPEVFDPRVEYPLPDAVAERIEFTGYVVREVAEPGRRKPRERAQVLVTMGGGEDGAERVHAWLDALALAPPAFDTTVVLGPLFDPAVARVVRQRARALERVHVQSFRADLPSLIAASDLVVAMAGYNTAAEVLATGARAIFLPRTFPRREQEIRAERLARLGLATTLVRPSPRALREAAEALLAAPPPERAARPSLEGCARVCARVAAVLAQRAPARARP